MALYLQVFVLVKFDIDRPSQSSSFYVVFLLHGNGGVWKLSERTWRKKQLIHQQKKKDQEQDMLLFLNIVTEICTLKFSFFYKVFIAAF